MKRIRVFGWQTSGGAEQHFRIDLPWLHINEEEFELHRGWNPTIETLREFDVVFCHRLAGHNDTWLQACADPNILTIYDMDDDLLCVDPENAPIYSIFHPLEQGTRESVLAADIITTSSPGMSARYEVLHPRVYMLPIVIPGEMLAYGRVDQWGPPIVGWAGSHFKGQDWAATSMANHLAHYAGRRPDAQFVMMGADYTRGMLRGRCSYVPFSTVGDYYHGLNRFNIGLAPLMQSRFNESKTRTKIAEYGARGIPTIASAVGEYAVAIEDGVNGFLVHEPHQWVDYLLELSEPKRRAEMADAAYALASEWTAERNAHHWERVFRGEV